METKRKFWLAYMAYVFYIVIFASIFYIQEIQNTISHEQAHVQIMKHDGCQNPMYKVNYKDASGYTKCMDKDRTRYEWTKESELHMLNEIVGYNVRSIANSVLIGCFLIGIAVFLSRK